MSKKTRIYILRYIHIEFFSGELLQIENKIENSGVVPTYYNSTTYKVQYKRHRIGKEVKIIFIYSTIEGCCCFFPCQRFVPHRQIELGDF